MNGFEAVHAKAYHAEISLPFNSIEWIPLAPPISLPMFYIGLSIPLNGFGSNCSHMDPMIEDDKTFNSIEWIRFLYQEAKRYEILVKTFNSIEWIR